VVQVSGHLDYARQMDAVLEVIGIRTRKHVELGAADSLQQWTAFQHCDHVGEAAHSASATPVSPLTDSAFGDEVDVAVEAIDYVETSEDGMRS